LASPARESGREQHGPQAVARVAQDELRENPYLDGMELSCDWEDGVLVLYGRVSSYYQKQRAQEAVKKMDGVAEVDNRIRVDS
jgi:osmotically-inducible protein OsmY